MRAQDLVVHGKFAEVKWTSTVALALLHLNSKNPPALLLPGQTQLVNPAHDRTDQDVAAHDEINDAERENDLIREP